jgi:hypothetical protein
MEGSVRISQGSPAWLSRTHVLVASVGIAIAVALVIGLVTFTRLGAAATTTPVTDGSYDAVERSRSLQGATGLVGSTSSGTSYDQVEAARVRIVLPAQTADHSYDDVERIRSHRGGG